MHALPALAVLNRALARLEHRVADALGLIHAAGANQRAVEALLERVFPHVVIPERVGFAAALGHVGNVDAIAAKVIEVWQYTHMSGRFWEKKERRSIPSSEAEWHESKTAIS